MYFHIKQKSFVRAETHVLEMSVARGSDTGRRLLHWLARDANLHARARMKVKEPSHFG